MIVGMLIWALAAVLVGIFAGSRYGSRAAASGRADRPDRGRPVRRVHGDHVLVACRDRDRLAVFLGLATALAGAFAANGGIDIEALKARYIPQATIDTTKETIEWAQARMPGGRRP